MSVVESMRSITTPLGDFLVWCRADGSLRTGWEVDQRDVQDPIAAGERTELLDAAEALLHAYFDGAPVDFSSLPLPDGPEFHLACWRAAQGIERGSTIGYAGLAVAAGSSATAARAAGQAMRSNPVAVIVPCHRVIASDGRLGGFAGSTDPESDRLAWKRFLLGHEGATVPRR